jgi:hypothetical protein
MAYPEINMIIEKGKEINGGVIGKFSTKRTQKNTFSQKILI